MKEVRTCEEYVLNELKKARDQHMLDADMIDKLVHESCCQDKLLEVIRKRAEIHTLGDGTRVINIRSVFEKFSEDDYYLWEEFLNYKGFGEEED